MFPVQLMTVRRSKNGIVRSVFLSEENTDYSISVMDVFSRCIGKSRLEIEKEGDRPKSTGERSIWTCSGVGR